MESYEFALRKFVAPEFVFGIDARRLASRYAKNFGARKVLLVTDPGVMAAGWAGDVLEDLRGAGLECAVFSSVTSAVHAMAHSLGGLLDSPHGECNAVLLPYVIEFNFAAFRSATGRSGGPWH